MIMPLFQKLEYINQDFLKSKLYLSGDIPADKAAADQWFENNIKYASEFSLKYKDKGTYVTTYVNKMLLDYMDSVEKLYKEKFA